LNEPVVALNAAIKAAPALTLAPFDMAAKLAALAPLAASSEPEAPEAPAEPASASASGAAPEVKRAYPAPAETPTQQGPKGMRFDFNDGCRVMLPEGEHPWRVRLSDMETCNILFETELKAGRVNSTKRYFVRGPQGIAQRADRELQQHLPAAGDVRHRFDHKDFLWCPRHKGTLRQFECARRITADHVKAVIKRNLGFGAHKQAQGERTQGERTQGERTQDQRAQGSARERSSRTVEGGVGTVGRTS
jgi:hypothetical protein